MVAQPSTAGIRPIAEQSDEVDGKSVSHMAETDYTDTSDDWFGGC
jgi:hypothetical protein